MIIGAKTIIRPINENDASLLCQWWSNGIIMKHVGFHCGIQTDIDKLREVIREEINDKAYNRPSRLFIIMEKSTERAIGEISFHELNLREKSCGFGIKICELAYQGNGYGEEALRNFLRYLFEKFDLHRIELDTLIDNVRAQNLYKKLGFKEIGVRRDGFVDSMGVYRDVVLMDLIKNELL